MWAKLLLLFFVFSFLFRSDLSFDQDLGRHLKLGEIIWQSKEVPKINLFSYTNPDFPFINTHWFFGVVIYGFSQTIGLYWLLIVKLAIFILSVWLIIKTIPKENQVLLLPIGFIFLHVLRERLELRPEIFSFLFTALTLYILERFLKKATKLIYLLPIIQLVWINTHIYFFIGIGLQAIFLIHLTYQKIRSHSSSGKIKLLGSVFGLSVIISLINPNGLNGVLYPLNVNKNYGYTIVENQTIFLLENIGFSNPNFLFVKLCIGIILLSLLTALVRRKWEIKNILLTLGGLGLALLNVRSIPYLVFLSLSAILQNFGQIPFKFPLKLLNTVVSILLLIESLVYLSGDYYKFNDRQHQSGLSFVQSVKGGMDFVITRDLPGPIFNNFDIGSYIGYRGFPKYKVFVDGRPEAYPASFFSESYISPQADPEKYKKIEEKYGFKTIIFSHTDQTPWGRTFLQNIVKNPEWIVVYIDDFVIILVKSEVINEKNLKAVDLTRLSPNSYQFSNHLSFIRIGYFLLSAGNQQSGREFILKGRDIFPDSPAINLIMGNPPSNRIFW